MTTRQSPGGRIPPDGRAPQAPGVGRTAKRHDLERPKTPGLQGDLQQGEVGATEKAMQDVPIGKKTQAPAQPGTAQRRNQPVRTSDPRAGGPNVPNPVEFATRRYGGGFTGAPLDMPGGANQFDPAPFMPLLTKLAANPNSGGTLASLVVRQLGALTLRTARSQVIDRNALDRAVEETMA